MARREYALGKPSNNHRVDRRANFAAWLRLFRDRQLKRGKTIREICWRSADFDEGYFSRLCSEKQPPPSDKRDCEKLVFQLAIGLELGIGEIDLLLQAAGFDPDKGDHWYWKTFGVEPRGAWMEEIYDYVSNPQNPPLDLNLPYKRIHVPDSL